jgi:tetratricopeptide (TPR) repeat protein
VRLRLCSATLTLFLLLAAAAQAQDGTAAPRATAGELRIARGYLSQAETLYRQGRYEPAAQLLQTALEFRPRFPEAALLLARLYSLNQETTRQAIDQLVEALRWDTLTVGQRIEAVTELAGLYVRTSRFTEARRIIASLQETGLGARGSAELSVLWARSLMGLGELAAAEAYLGDALRRFPRAPQLYILQAETLSRRGNRRAALDSLERGSREMPEDAELLYQQAVLQRDGEARSRLVERYYQVGGDDPGAALLVMEAFSEDPGGMLDLFFQRGGNLRIGYLDRLAEALGADLVAARTRDYSGTRIRDRDRDGYSEQLYEYQRGTLIRWSEDGDQDGIEEVTVLLQEGIPAIVTAIRGPGGEDLQYSYSEYPFLSTASLTGEGSVRRYSLIPYTVRRPVFAELSPAGLERRLDPGLVSAEPFLRRNSFQIVEYGPDSQLPLRRTHLLEGRIVRVEEQPGPSGDFRRTIFYDGTVAVAAQRDLDGDGHAEIREEFRNGSLHSITLDQDGDGRGEFRQVFEPEGALMYWDYDNDGSYDRRESTIIPDSEN